MNSPAITALTLDEAPQRLWHEWLTSYFDGAVHTVLGSGVSFPRATVGFDVADIGQPLSGVGIVVVTEAESSDAYLSESGKTVHADCQWLIYVRGGAPGPGDGNSRHLCRRAAQLVRGLILDDSATAPLAQKGLMNLEPAREQVLPVNDNPVRLLRVRGKLQVE